MFLLIVGSWWRGRNSLEKRISQCGDFDCQYFLVILVQHWLAWSGKQTAENYLEAAFPLVSLQLRRLLLKVQDFEYVSLSHLRRNFFLTDCFCFDVNSNVLCNLLGRTCIFKCS